MRGLEGIARTILLSGVCMSSVEADLVVDPFEPWRDIGVFGRSEPLLDAAFDVFLRGGSFEVIGLGL